MRLSHIENMDNRTTTTTTTTLHRTSETLSSSCMEEEEEEREHPHQEHVKGGGRSLPEFLIKDRKVKTRREETRLKNRWREAGASGPDELLVSISLSADTHTHVCDACYPLHHDNIGMHMAFPCTSPLTNQHTLSLSVYSRVWQQGGWGGGVEGVGQTLFSCWLLLPTCGEFCSLRSSVVSSGPFSMWAESASWCVTSVMAMAGGLLSLRLLMFWLLSGDCGVLSRRDAISPFWYWARVI